MMSEDKDNKPLSERRMHYGHPDMTSFQGYKHDQLALSGAERGDGDDGTATGSEQEVTKTVDKSNDAKDYDYGMTKSDDQHDSGLKEDITYTIQTNTDLSSSLKDITNLQNIPYPEDIRRHDSFDEAIRYPTLKQGIASPDIETSKQSLITPDEVFGPVSPRRSYSYEEEPVNRPFTSQNNIRKTSLTETTRPGSKLVRYNSKKRTPSRQFTSSNELPLRSQSRYEPANPYNQTPTIPAASGITNSQIPEIRLTSSLAENNRGTLASRNQDRKSENPGILSTTTVSIERNNFTTHPMVRDSKMRLIMSQLSNFSKGSSYDHGDYVDDNLLISAARLDNTLIRLFSDPNPEDKEYRHQNGGVTMPYIDYAQSDLISMDPVKWRVRPMEASQRETLDVELIFIEENLQPRDLVKRLYQDEVLTLMDYNQINRTDGQGERAVTRLLVRTLQRRGHTAYPAFIKALSDMGYTHVVNKLTGTEHAIRAGMSRDSQMRQRNEYNKTFVLGPTHSNPDLNGGLTPVDPTHLSLPDMSHRHSKMDDTISDHHETHRSPKLEDRASSVQLQKHLDDVKSELRALHDDVTALKSARKSSLATAKNDATDNPDVATTNNAKKDGKDTAQKSSSCTVL